MAKLRILVVRGQEFPRGGGVLIFRRSPFLGSGLRRKEAASDSARERLVTLSSLRSWNGTR